MKDYSEFVGKKWVYKENDCIAVVRKILLELFGTEVHEIALPNDSSFAHISPVFEAEKNSERWHRVDEAQEGVAALFYNRKGQAFHIGLCVDTKNIIHCPGSKRHPGETIIERFKDLPSSIYSRVEFYVYNCR